MLLKKIFKSNILHLIIAVILLSGCVKKDPISSIAQVLLVPLSPNAPSVDFSIKGALTATTVGYSTTTGSVRYTLPYYTITPSASTTVAYNLTGTSNALASVTKDIAEDNVYSTFLIDSVGKAKAVIVSDDLTEPNPGKIKIRFFHFSPNTVPMDVVISGATTKLFAGRSFNDQATNASFEKFIEIDPGTYTFQFLNASTGVVLYTTTAQTLLTERIYTLAARGFTGGTGTQAIGAWVYPNKP